MNVIHEEAKFIKLLDRFWSNFERRYLYQNNDRIFKNQQNFDDNFEQEEESLLQDDLKNDYFNQYNDLSEDAPKYPKKDSLPNLKVGSLSVVDETFVSDIHADYVVRNLRRSEFPVIGTMVHPRIVQGFYYLVRPLDSDQHLFQEKALCLKKIGIGYGKRLTFESDTPNQNDNYFWSDTNPEGYGFSLQLVHQKDKLIIKDINDIYVASIEVVEILEAQIETSQSIRSNKVEKEAKVHLKCIVQHYESTFTNHEHLIILGTAVAIKDVKSKNPASLIKIKNCKLNGQKGFTLYLKSVSPSFRIVSGNNINDIPTTYTVTGLNDHELPVIGTVVDSHIIPGFKYKVRELDCNKYLFNGNALPLISIGRGYGKRITFSGSDNFFWSDTNQAGYGFTIEAISVGQEFRIEDCNGRTVGKAEIYKAEIPQKEIESKIINGICIKMVRVSVSCHLSLYGYSDLTTIVTGIATVERRKRFAEVTMVENIAIGSRINNLLTKEGMMFLSG